MQANTLAIPPANRLKCMVVLNSGVYLRHYGSLFDALAERGHHVLLAYSAPNPGDTALTQALIAGRHDIEPIEAPQRTGWWWAAADPLRALRDYVHYLDPAFDGAPKLVERAGRRLPRPARRLLGGRKGSRLARRKAMEAALALVERSLPTDPGVHAWLQRHQPDLVLVSPLVDFDYRQLELLKSAIARGIPTGHLVASWDNLTNKGRIQIAADKIIVWNAFQRDEAVNLHGVPPDRVVVTGAQLYDHWFAQKPSERGRFCARLGGLDPARPIILYAGSSRFICADETPFVLDWLRRIRAHDDPLLRQSQIIVRPHPQNAGQWREVDLGPLGPAVIWPPAGVMPIADDERQDFFDSLSHAAAVVGINTSVFLEAAIVGRPSFAVPGSQFAVTQDGTLHFRYIAGGGLVETADGLADHLAALGKALRGEWGRTDAARAFLQAFLRPHGLDRPALPFVVDAVEQLAAMPYGRLEQAPRTGPLIRALLAPLAATYLRPRYLAQLMKREARERTP